MSATETGPGPHLREPAAVHRPVPRPARARHRPARPLQAHAGRRRLLAGRREEPDAPAHLRHGVGVEEGPRRAPDRLEEAEKRDHRKLGAELDLFSFPDEIGSGLAVFHPKGGIVRRLMEDYSPPAPRGRPATSSSTRPHITKADLFETSGPPRLVRRRHVPADGAATRARDYYLKPMNCPFHILIYQSRQRSYRELPLRLFEFGTVYRYEKSGVVHGLTRVRGITQDDAHIFCTKEQMAERAARRCSTSCSTCCATTASTTSTSSCRPSPRRRRSAPTRSGTRPPRRCARSRRVEGPRARARRGRRRVLRPEDLGAGPRRHRPHVADVDDPARLPARRSASASSTSAPTAPATRRS